MADEAAPIEQPPRPPRVGYCLIQAAALSVLHGLVVVAARYLVIFTELGMANLPAPTELVLSFAKGWMNSYAHYGAAVLGLILIALALRGKLDRYLRTLIVINIVWASVMIPFVFLSLHLPLQQIQKSLEEK